MTRIFVAEVAPRAGLQRESYCGIRDVQAVVVVLS
jgi:hypothetical protein